MFARLDDVRFGDRKIIASVGFYFSVGEAGYDEYYREELDGLGNPTGVFKLYPFNTIPFNLPLDAQPAQLREKVVAKLRAFKESHTVVANFQPWVGTEIQV